MEKGRMMLLHSAIIGILLYIFMIFILGQNENVAENRSILLAAVMLIYMIVFGHGLPTSINKNLFYLYFYYIFYNNIGITNDQRCKLKFIKSGIDFFIISYYFFPLK